MSGRGTRGRGGGGVRDLAGSAECRVLAVICTAVIKVRQEA